MPLGTGGCLKTLQKYKKNDYLIIMGDLIFNIDFKKFYLFHKKNKSDFTLLVHPNDHPFDSDLVQINEKNRLVRFHKNHITSTILATFLLQAFFLLTKRFLNLLSLINHKTYQKIFYQNF